MKYVLTVILLLVLNTVSYAKETDFTGQKQWNVMTAGERTAYLAGLNDGFGTMHLFPNFLEVLPANTTIGKLNSFLTTFYKNVPESENLDIPAAIFLFWMSSKDFTEDKIQDNANLFIALGSKQVLMIMKDLREELEKAPNLFKQDEDHFIKKFPTH